MRHVKDIESGLIVNALSLDEGLSYINALPKCEYVAFKKKCYAKDFATFDIETTNMDYYGFMYTAQFAVDSSDNFILVRRWEEVVKILQCLTDKYCFGKRKYVIYVHNLGFEFQFMHAFLHIKKVFAVKERVPLRVETEEGIEFRCSWKLSNMSLDQFLCKTPNVKHYKQTGKFDYSIIRTCDTELTDTDILYCGCDVIGLHEAIDERLKEHNLATIPMTSTGYVREECRQNMRKNRNNRLLVQSCELDAYLYLLLRTARRGGDCNASSLLSSEIHEDVDSYDIKSSYPYIIMTQPVPMGEWIPDSCTHMCPERAYLMIVELRNVRLKDSAYIGYIAWHKTIEREKAVNCNGRIIKADRLKMVICEFDLKIIKERYDADITILEGYSCRKQLLPKELRQTVADYFQGKCDLEGVDKLLYDKFKNLINAIFGMMLTDITNDDITFNNGVWDTEKVDIDKALYDYFKSENAFLAYQWGVWVVGLARARLSEPYLSIYEYAIYSDTDSWKLAKGYDNSIFKRINDKIIAEAETYDVKPYAYRKDGTKEYLGVWEFEGNRVHTYDRFITLGAKKYCTEIDGKIGVTVSGLSKDLGSEYLDSIGGIDAFKDGLVFPVGHSGRTVSYYDDNSEIRQITVNGSTFTTAASITIHDTTYTLDRTGVYRSILDAIKQYGIENIE